MTSILYLICVFVMHIFTVGLVVSVMHVFTTDSFVSSHNGEGEADCGSSTSSVDDGDDEDDDGGGGVDIMLKGGLACNVGEICELDDARNNGWS